jgi:hypothetical protein
MGTDSHTAASPGSTIAAASLRADTGPHEIEVRAMSFWRRRISRHWRRRNQRRDARVILFAPVSVT